MSLTVGQLNAFVDLDTARFDRGLDKAEGRMGRTGTALAGIAKKAALGTVAALGAGAVAGVNQFGRLERGMNEVFTLMPGISQDAMGAMTEDVKAFSKEFGTLPNEVVPALYQSLSAGVPPDNVFEFMETAQQAAIGGVTDLSTAVDGITSVVNAYGDQIGGAAEASDLMFTAVRLGKTDFEQLSSSLFNVIPTASALGVEFSDVTAAMAAMTAQGTPTSVATTQMRQLLVELSKEGTATSETFEELAGKSFREFVAGGGDVESALAMMADEAEKSGGSISDMFGSVEAGSAALSLTSEKGAQLFGDALDEMAASAGSTEKAYDQMDQGIARSWDKIKAAGAVALADLGQALAPAVASMAGFAENVLPRVSEAIEHVRQVVEQWRPAIVDAFTTARKIVADVVGTIQGFLDRFRSGLGSNSDAISGWRDTATKIFGQVKSLVASVFGAIQTIIRTAVTIISAFWERFGRHLVDFAARQFTRIMDIVSGALQFFRGIFDLINSVLTGQWGDAWQAIKDIIAGAWSVIRSVVAGMWDSLKTMFGAGVAAVSQVWSFLWDQIKSALAAAWRNIKQGVADGVDAVLGWFTELPGRIFNAIGDLTSDFFDLGIDVIRGLLDGILSMGGELASTVGDFVHRNTVGRAKSLLGISSPSKAFMELGEAVVDGLAVGVSRGGKHATSAVAKLVDQVRETMPKDKWLRLLAKEVQESIVRFEQRIGKAKDRLKRLREESKQFASSIADQFSGGVFRTSEGETFEERLRRQLQTARKFRAALNKALRQGLSAGLVQQLAKAGPAALDDATRLASKSRQEIARLNRQFAQLEGTSGRIGRMSAGGVFGADIRRSIGQVQALRNQRYHLGQGIADNAGGGFGSMTDNQLRSQLVAALREAKSSVTVNAETNADPSQIGEEVAWTLRTSA